MIPRANLQRSTDNRMLCGVAGGIAEYMDVDVGLVRIGWVVLACATFGLAAICYAVLCIFMPNKTVGVAAPPYSGGPPRDFAVPADVTRAAAKDLNHEARLLLEVRRELGPEYEDELVESFVDKVEESMKGRRTGQSRARSVDTSDTLLGRNGRTLLVFGVIAVGAFLLARSIGLV